MRSGDGDEGEPYLVYPPVRQRQGAEVLFFRHAGLVVKYPRYEGRATRFGTGLLLGRVRGVGGFVVPLLAA
jgi:hypothetical protein